MESKTYGRKVIRRRKQYTRIGIIFILYTLVVFFAGFTLGALVDDLVDTTAEPVQQAIVTTVK